MAGHPSINCYRNCLRRNVCIWSEHTMKLIMPLDWHQKRQQAEMPAVAETLLDLIRRLEPIKITDLATAAEKEKLGSRAHVFANLNWLRNTDYVTVSNPNNNLRIKELSVAQKALDYFEVNV